MKNLIFIVLLALTSALASCSHTEKKQSAPAEAVVVNKATASKDTLTVQGKWIIFFQPSQADYAEMQRNGVDSNFFTIASQFSTYRDTMVDSLKKTKWADMIQLNERRYLVIKLNNGKKVVFDRTKSNDMVGMILTDGKQSPDIESGVSNNRVWWAAINWFFGEK
ncbi:hypothetical protein C8P68_106166 [Mucilaginibacter yixingensis]|uniref:Uncharacterized protein n=1 Tax=Mucilaginibacter yixingensis TaxID=1295612 RepID=A0A2T5J721_9SPHI|nr:hypothetical protein [Mucilaginibacter yixingensis]PTQ94952.1 hypothetical protein C8P68_106166 [Mucilaginibacter yixingensis]